MTVRFLTLAMSPAAKIYDDHRRCTAVVAMMALMVGAVGNNAVRLNGTSAVLCRDLHWNAVVGLDTGIDCKNRTFLRPYGRPHPRRRRGVQFVGRISVRCAEFA